MRFQSAIDFVSRLTPAHLQSFWYFASKVNLAIIGTFGSVLWATSDTTEEVEFYKAQLAEYRWTLRVSSKGAEFMQFTVSMLDASPVFLKEGDSNPGTAAQDADAHDAEEDDNMDGNNEKKDDRRTIEPEHEQISAQPTPPFYYNNYNAAVPMQGVQDPRPEIYQFSGTGSGVASDNRVSWAGFNPPEAFMTGASDWSLGDFNYGFDGVPASDDMTGHGGEYDHNEANFAEF